MALLRDVLLSKPKFSNFDKSFKNTITAASGPLYPVLTDECLPGDTHSIRVMNDVKTYPLLSPFLGTFKQQIAFFFIPTRLYVQMMDLNYLSFNVPDVSFPKFTMPSTVAGTAIASADNIVRKNSILDLLGVFAGSSFTSQSGAIGTVPLLNAIPLIGYYDIFRNYFCNTQERNFYYLGRSSYSNDYELQPAMLSQLDSLPRQFVNSGTVNFETAWSNSFSGQPISGVNPIVSSTRTPLGGLVLRTHRPDMLNAWLSNGTYTSMVSGSSVSTSGDQFTVNQLRFATHLMEYYERGLVAGGRYDDWVEAQYGVKTNKNLCIPELLGVVSSTIRFDEVVSTASVNDAAIAGQGELGSLAGRGYGQISSREIRFTCSEHGYIMAIYSIVPNVSYSSGLRQYLQRTRMTDIYTPSMQRIGFEPIMASNFYAGLLSTNDSKVGEYNFTSSAIGYQPAWTDYMTKLSEAHGDVGLTGDLSYWCNLRTFTNRYQTNGLALLVTSYVIPTQFNYPFANQSLLAENFIVDFAFDWRARRPIGKSVMPTLA